MLGNIFTVGTNVIILFIIIARGVVSNKVKLVSNEGIKSMTNIVLYIVTPCVIINSYQREFDKTMLLGLGVTALATVVSLALCAVVSHLLIHDKDKRREKTLIFAAVFSNAGYMSLPLQQALLGDDGVFYGATYVAMFNIVAWTYGIVEMSRDFKNISPKKIVFNPGVVGTVIGIILFVFSIKLPGVIKTPISYMAALNTPIPMFIVGYQLANAKLKITGKNAFLAIALRLLILPLIMLFGLYLCGITGTLYVACVIAAAAPCAALTAMFSERFDGDTGLASTLVSLTTLLSVITMPIIVGIATML